MLRDSVHGLATCGEGGARTPEPRGRGAAAACCLWWWRPAARGCRADLGTHAECTPGSPSAQRRRREPGDNGGAAGEGVRPGGVRAALVGNCGARSGIGLRPHLRSTCASLAVHAARIGAALRPRRGRHAQASAARGRASACSPQTTAALVVLVSVHAWIALLLALVPAPREPRRAAGRADNTRPRTGRYAGVRTARRGCEPG